MKILACPFSWNVGYFHLHAIYCLADGAVVTVNYHAAVQVAQYYAWLRSF